MREIAIVASVAISRARDDDFGDVVKTTKNGTEVKRENTLGLGSVIYYLVSKTNMKLDQALTAQLKGIGLSDLRGSSSHELGSMDKPSNDWKSASGWNKIGASSLVEMRMSGMKHRCTSENPTLPGIWNHRLPPIPRTQCMRLPQFPRMPFLEVQFPRDLLTRKSEASPHPVGLLWEVRN